MSANDWLIGNGNDIVLDSFADEWSGAVENDVTAYASLCVNTSAVIVGATNANPIVITTATAHGFSTGNTVTVVNVGGNGAAKGTFVVTVIDSLNFSLQSSAGDGAYTGGGEVFLCIANASALAMSVVGNGTYLVSKDGSIPLTEGQQLTLIIYCLGSYRDLFNAIVEVTARKRG